MKPIIRTYSGKYIEPLNITSEDIDVEDIIVAGSNICRFGGHLDEIYSINEHQILCYNIAKSMYPNDKKLQLLAGTHDICEIYSPVGDCLKPCKDFFSVQIDGKILSINEYEDYLQAIIAESLFGYKLDYNNQKLKLIDKIALNTESLNLRGNKISDDYLIFNNFKKLSVQETRNIYKNIIISHITKVL